MKIGVQGWEDEVVGGGWGTILAHTPVLLVETPSRGLEQRLTGEGSTMLEVVDARLQPSRRRVANQLAVRAPLANALAG